MTLVGGLGTIFGPVAGAAVIITMENYLAQLGAWVTVVQGVIFVLCVLAFVLSATLSGLAGGTKAIVFQLASLTDVNWPMSGEVVLMCLVGGLGTVFGPVAGALVIITMENYLAQLGAWVTVVQGAIFVVCVLAFRRGIIGELGTWLKRPL
jgi:branched-chain amino acid transport system permease protein